MNNTSRFPDATFIRCAEMRANGVTWPVVVRTLLVPDYFRQSFVRWQRRQATARSQDATS